MDDFTKLPDGKPTPKMPAAGGVGTRFAGESSGSGDPIPAPVPVKDKSPAAAPDRNVSDLNAIDPNATIVDAVRPPFDPDVTMVDAGLPVDPHRDGGNAFPCAVKLWIFHAVDHAGDIGKAHRGAIAIRDDLLAVRCSVA